MGIKTKINQQRETIQTRLTGFKTELPKKMYGNQSVPDSITLSDVPDYIKGVIPNRIALHDKFNEVGTRYENNGKYAFDVITPSLQAIVNEKDMVRIELFDDGIVYRTGTTTNEITISTDYMITTACFFENRLYVAVRNRDSLGSYIVTLSLSKLQTLAEINILTETVHRKFDDLFTKKIIVRNNKLYYMNYTSINNTGIYKIYNSLGKYISDSIIDSFCFVGGMYYILQSTNAIVCYDSQEIYNNTKVSESYNGIISCKNNLFVFAYDEITKTTKIRFCNPTELQWMLSDSTALVSSVNTKFVSWYCVNDCIYAIDILNTIYISNDGFRWREYLKHSSITSANTQLYISRHIAASKYSGLQLVLSPINNILQSNIYEGSKDFSGTKWNNKELYTIENEKYNGLTVLSSTTQYVGLHQEFNATAGEIYRISAYIKSSVSDNMYYETKIVNPNTKVKTSHFTIPANTWTYVRYEFKVDKTDLYRAIFQSKTTDKVSICGIMLEKIEGFNPGYVCAYTNSFASGENVVNGQMCYSDEGDQLIGCRNIYEITNAPVTESHTTSLDSFFYMNNVLYGISQGELLKYTDTQKSSLGNIAPNKFMTNMQSGNFIYQTGEAVLFYATDTSKRELWYVTQDNLNELKIATVDIDIDNIYTANGFIYIQSGNAIYEITINYVSDAIDTVSKTLVYTVDASKTLIRSHVNYPYLYYIGATTLTYTFTVFNLSTNTEVDSKTITEVCPRTGYGLSAIGFAQRKDGGIAVSVNKKLISYTKYEKFKVKELSNYIKLLGEFNNQYVYLLNSTNTTSFKSSPVFLAPNDMLRSSILPIGDSIMSDDNVIVNRNGIFVKFADSIARVSNKYGSNITNKSISSSLPVTIQTNTPINTLIFFDDINNGILDMIYISLDNDIVINGQTTNRLRIVETTTGIDILTGDDTKVTIDALTNQFITIGKHSDKTPLVPTPVYNYIYTNKK